MASVVVTIRVMPDSPDADMGKMEHEAVEAMKAFGALTTKVQIEPIAFGLKALKCMLVIDEAKGDTEQLEKKIGHIHGVQSVEVTDVRRTFG